MMAGLRPLQLLPHLRSLSTLAVLAFCLAAAPQTAAAQQAECFDKARMGERIAASGLAWEQRRDDLWRVDMPSRTRDMVRVIASCGQKIVPVFAVLADAKDLEPTADLFHFLLRAASHFDQVKLAIDPDGDYLVRIDLNPRSFGGDDLAAAAQQITDVVDSLTPPLRERHAAR